MDVNSIAPTTIDITPIKPQVGPGHQVQQGQQGQQGQQAPAAAQSSEKSPSSLAIKAVGATNANDNEKQQYESSSNEVIERTLEQINKSISAYNREMHISVHAKTQRIMVKVMDTTENRVIRELPPEKVLDAFAKTLELAGILIDTRR